MSKTRSLPLRTILDAAVATGVGTTIEVSDFRNAILALDIAAASTLAIKIQGSIADEAPDFTAAQSVSNQWDYVQVIDMNSGLPIDGDTGISVTGAAENKQLALNIEGLAYINVQVVSWSAGSVSAKVKTFTNA